MTESSREPLDDAGGLVTDEPERGDQRRAGQWEPIAPAVVLAVLAFSAVALILRSPRADDWFIGDDWGMLTDRSLLSPGGLFEPQNGHWSTVPLLVYQTLFWVFGLHHYVVFRLVIALLHVVIVALVWMVMVRLGVRSWFATAMAATLLFIGSMPTNLVAPIQVSQSGSIACGLAMLLLVDHDGPLDRRDLVAVGFGVMAFASSSVGVIMVGVVGLFLILRRGVRVAALAGVVLGGVYGAWRLAYRDGASAAYELDVATLWSWAYQGMTATFSLPTRSSAAALLLAAVTVAGLILLVTRGTRRCAVPASQLMIPALAIGALTNFVAIATQRSFFGEMFARSDRYVYISFVLLLPVFALALEQFAVWGRLVPVVLAAPLLLAVPGNIGELVDPPAFRFPSVEPLFTAAARDPLAESVRSDLILLPDMLTGRTVTIGWLLDVDRQGRLPAPPEITPELEAEVTVRLSLSRQLLAADPAEVCASHDEPVRVMLRQGEAVRVDQSVLVGLVENGELVSQAILFHINEFSRGDHLVGEVPRIELEISGAGDGPLTLCRRSSPIETIETR